MTIRSGSLPSVRACASLVCALALISTPAAAQKTRVVGSSALPAFPAETTLLLQFPNVADFVDKVKASPLYRLKDRPQFEGILKKFDEALNKARNESKAEVGVDPLELLKSVRGEALLVVGDLTPLARSIAESVSTLQSPDVTPSSFPVLFSFDTLERNDAFQKDLQKLFDAAAKKDVRVKSEDFHGARITTLSPPEDDSSELKHVYVAQKDSRYMIAVNDEFLRQTLANLSAEGKGGRLQDNPVFQASRQLTGNGMDMFVYVNVKAITRFVSTVLSGNFFAIYWTKAEEILIGKNFNGVGVGMSLAPRGIVQKLLFHNGGADDGFLGWLKGDSFPAKPSPVLPEGATNWSTISMNFPKLAIAIREVATVAMSFQGGGQDLDALFKENFGLELNDVIRAFGRRLHFFMEPPTASSPDGSVGVVVELADEAPIQALLTKVSELLQGSLSTKKYLNRDLYSFGPGGGDGEEVAPTLSVADRMLIFGTEQSSVQKVIRRLGKDLPGLAESEGYKKASSGMLQVPAQVSALSFASEDYFSTMISGLSEQIESEVSSEDVPPELFEILSAVAKTLGASIGYAAWIDSGYFSESVLYYRE